MLGRLLGVIRAPCTRNHVAPKALSVLRKVSGVGGRLSYPSARTSLRTHLAPEFLADLDSNMTF